MTIQYTSDLHLDFRENKAFPLKHPIQPFILACDIVTFSGMKNHLVNFEFNIGAISSLKKEIGVFIK
jgi:hypothetical protein